MEGFFSKQIVNSKKTWHSNRKKISNKGWGILRKEKVSYKRKNSVEYKVRVLFVPPKSKKSVEYKVKYKICFVQIQKKCPIKDEESFPKKVKKVPNKG